MVYFNSLSTRIYDLFDIICFNNTFTLEYYFTTFNRNNLTGIFGLDGLSGVGISFGADRIYDVLLELGLFPSEAEVGTQVLFANFSEEDAAYLMPIVARLRREGIRSEIYPEPVKMKKQMSYADSLKIPFVVLVGEEERTTSTFTLKDMQSGQQEKLTLDALISHLSAQH